MQNRKIAFRAWDRVIKRMAEWDAEIDWIRIIKNSPRNGIEVMQFTGLLDRNGKEIYEGDVVKLPEVQFYHLTIAEVRFQNQQFDPVSFFRSESIEVIGNVWENPELLN